MAKKNKSKAANLVMVIVSLAMAAISLVGLACNFISRKTTIAGYSATANWNLSQWFNNINDLKDIDENIGNWQVARVMLFVTIVLLAVMVVSLLLKCFTKKSVMIKWLTFGLAIAVLGSAIAFTVTTLTGCSALSYEIALAKTSVKYFSNLGFYLFSLGAAVSSIMTAVVVCRK